MPSWVPPPRGDLGLFGLRQSHFFSPVLKGCVSLEENSKTKRAVAGASPSGSTVCLLICRRAGIFLYLLLWLCSGFLSDQAAGLWCLLCVESCLPSVSRSIFIQSYFNIKVCLSRNDPFACGVDGEVQVQCLCLCQSY